MARKKSRIPKTFRNRLEEFDMVSGAVIGSLTKSVRRTNRSLKRLNKKLNRLGDAFEKFYDDHSNCDSNF